MIDYIIDFGDGNSIFGKVLFLDFNFINYGFLFNKWYFYEVIYRLVVILVFFIDFLNLIFEIKIVEFIWNIIVSFFVFIIIILFILWICKMILFFFVVVVVFCFYNCF